MASDERDKAPKRDSFDTATGEVLGAPSEHAIARAFTAKYRGLLHFDHNAGKWFEWTGTRWQRNDTKIAFHYARKLAVQASLGDAKCPSSQHLAHFAA